MSIKKRIVGVVGLGHVGAHVAYNLGMMGLLMKSSCVIKTLIK